MANNSRIEIWHNEELEDFAEVFIEKETSRITWINTGYGDFDLIEDAYADGIAYLKEEGYTEHDEYWDSFDSWEEWDEYISA